MRLVQEALSQVLASLKRAGSVLKASRNEAAVAAKGAVHGDAMDFLPAALEIQQRPPSPAGRWLLWSLLLLFSIGVCWMMVGKVDIVAVAQGKIIPNGKSKTIQSLVTGTVKEIRVQDGQRVSAGDVLIALDSQQISAELKQLQSRLNSSRAGLWRTQLLLQTLEGATETLPVALRVHQDGAKYSSALDAEPHMAAARDQAALIPSNLKQAELRLARRQYQALQAEIASLTATHRERDSERMTLENEIHKWEMQLPLITRRADSHKKLASNSHVSRDSWDQIEQQRIEISQNLKTANGKKEQIDAAIDVIKAQKASVLANQQASIEAQQREFSANIAQLQQEQVKAETQFELHNLVSPVTGNVQALSVHTVGGVVTPAQPLLTLVPENSELEVEAMFANKDIGFINVGQPVKVKVDAFPFTRYGALSGRVSSLSSDAVEVQNVGWVYAARVRLDNVKLLVEGKDVSVSPGMSVTVEVKTGKRQLVEYVLSPLLRYRDESVRER